MDSIEQSMTDYSKYIHRSRYSRYIDDLNRRETWPETVTRLCTFWQQRFPDTFPYELVYDNIVNMRTMPSMRSLMSAGVAATRDEVAVYNCSFIAIDDPKAFDEAMYLLMNGVGVGFSVERQFVNDLPTVAEEFFPTETVVIVKDSKIGWCSAFRELLSLLWAGKLPTWDLSRVRAKGERLKTFGGRASGPEPLNELFQFAVNVFSNAKGRKLTSLECHDLMCKIGEIVVVGGVRRSALISLSNLSDDRMRNAKSGAWWDGNVQRALANNSTAYQEKPDLAIFIKEILAIYESKSGERGIFNRVAAQKKARSTGRRKWEGVAFGTNPCGEILLRSMGLCNLSEVVVREDDTLETLKEKVRVATILGTFQSTMTNFRYLRSAWKKNAEEERLLGVSLTGEMDHPVLQRVTDEARRWLRELNQVAVDTNKEWAEKLGINQSVSITCVKPSGCRPETALVTTDKGIYTLGELRPEGQGVWQSLEREGHDTLGGGKATKFFDNGIAEVFAVNMNFGMSVESTANHQWEVKGKGFVRTDELEVGDVLEIAPGVYTKSTESPLFDVPNPQCNSVPIKMPSEMSADLAWLLGYLWGDGCLSPCKHRIRFIDANMANLEKARQILLNLFGLESNIFPASDNRKAFVLEKGSSHLWAWLVTNGFFKYTERGEIAEIPLRVREASKESILAFFAGLFDADGHFKNGKASLATADPKFSKHVQDIAWAVGLCLGRSHNTKGDNLQPTKSMWLMAVSANTSEEVWGVLQRHSNKITGDLSRQRQYTYGVVQDVVSIGEQPTYDIETEAHWFWAGAVKSHNTVSQLVDCASGLHGRFSPYYIRTVRADKKDPLAQVMKEAGIPCEDDVTKPHSTYVFGFPMKSPANARIASEIDAIEQLEIWKMYRDEWCEHNPSVTIYVGDDEWLKVAAWVWENFDSIGGISFLPRADHIYKQAPYQAISEEEYERLVKEQPLIPWDLLEQFEKEDQTTGTQELACVGNSCELPF